MKKNLILIFGLLFCIHSSAQDNYKAGYVINNEGDTLRGFIHFAPDASNCQRCLFKVNMEAEVLTYQPTDIKEYRLEKEGLYYVSRNIEIENKPRSVFVQYMVQGEMDLFYYVNPKEQAYFLFYSKDGKIITTLTKGDDVIRNRSIYPDTKYIGLLNYTFQDFPEILKFFDRDKFTQKTMIDVSKKYHEATCKPGEKCIVYTEKKPDKSFILTRFSLSGGYRRFDEGYEEAFLTNENVWKEYKPYNTFCIYGGISVLNPRISNQLSTEVGFEYTNLKNYSVFNMQHAANIQGGIRYLLSKNRLSPFVEGGVKYFLAWGLDREQRPGGYLTLYGAAGGNLRLTERNNLYLKASYDGLGFSIKLGTTF